jgi:hypothetical protein
VTDGSQVTNLILPKKQLTPRSTTGILTGKGTTGLSTDSGLKEAFLGLGLLYQSGMTVIIE